MATSKPSSPNRDDDVKEDYFDIEACTSTPLSILVKIYQPSTPNTPKRPLPIGVMTDRSVMDLVKKATGTTPIGIMLMNDTDVVIEFEKGTRVVEISQLLHSIDLWTGYKIEVACIVSTKRLLVETVKEIKENRRAVRELQEQKR